MQIGRIPGVSSSKFNNGYYIKLLRDGSGLGSDRQLLLNPGTRDIVVEYSKNNEVFLRDFRDAYIKLMSFGYQ
jgi:hypothetical protein